ncbi:MAG: VOC family protein, partial [Solirubrobacteraceae bacterium]
MTAPGKPGLLGIHHVTAICGDPQRNIDFWVGLLGLRLVKKTVNFDDPGSYHLYYGDGIGSPGTVMTFFAWAALPPFARATGHGGAGQIGTTSFAVPLDAFDFWVDRLADAGVDFEPTERFGDRVLALADPDGIRLELVARRGARVPAAWPDSPVPAERAVARIHTVTIVVHEPEPSA